MRMCVCVYVCLETTDREMKTKKSKIEAEKKSNIFILHSSAAAAKLLLLICIILFLFSAFCRSLLHLRLLLRLISQKPASVSVCRTARTLIQIDS